MALKLWIAPTSRPKIKTPVEVMLKTTKRKRGKPEPHLKWDSNPHKETWGSLKDVSLLVSGGRHYTGGIVADGAYLLDKSPI